MYAVERMLHDQKGEITIPLADDDTRYMTANGEIFSFDTPENTCCVLKDPETCHFHNQENFEEIVHKNQDSITIINRTDDPGRLKIFKPTDGYLYAKDKSCVRQLLDENITPFPYKVAKALDPSIYRNTEFEFWQEARNENRLKWQGVDANDKYFVHDHRLDSLPFTHPTSAIDESTYMALDDNLKKKYVYVSSKDDDCPKKLAYLTGFNNFRPSRESVEHIVMPIHTNYNRNNWRPRPQQRSYYNNHRYNGNFSNAPAHHEEREYQYIEQENVYSQPPPVYQDGYQYVSYSDPNSQVYQAPPPMQPQIVQYIPQTPHPMTYGHAYNQPQPVAFPNFSVPPPSIITYSSSPGNPANANSQPVLTAQKSTSSDQMNLIRDGELNANINMNPKESHDTNGNDLPLNDTNTMQFFFNLGVRYFYASGAQNFRRLESVANHLETLTIQDNSQQHGDQLRTDQPPPVPTNTPVTTKSPHNFAPPGNRSYHNNQFNYRRPFSHQNSRDHGNQKENNKGNRGGYNNRDRKEIQFNSNVKNVHKAETSHHNKHNGNGHSYNNNNSNNQNQGNQINATSTDKNNNSAPVAPMTTQAISPISASNENTGYSNEQTNNSLPALTIPPPQIPQMTYAVN